MQLSEDDIHRFNISEGGPNAPDKFVMRYKGALIRNTKGDPILFATRADALAFMPVVRRIQKEAGLW